MYAFQYLENTMEPIGKVRGPLFYNFMTQNRRRHPVECKYMNNSFFSKCHLRGFDSEPLIYCSTICTFVGSLLLKYREKSGFWTIRTSEFSIEIRPLLSNLSRYFFTFCDLGAIDQDRDSRDLGKWKKKKNVLKKMFYNVLFIYSE